MSGLRRTGDMGGKVLILVQVLACLIGLIVVFGAYLNLWSLKREMEHKAGEVAETVRGIGDPNVRRIDPNTVATLRHIVEEFGWLCRESAQSPTITFLFTVVSIVLVSGGAFLLERSRRYVNDTQAHADKLLDESRKNVNDIQGSVHKLLDESRREVEDSLKEVSELRGDLDDLSHKTEELERLVRAYLTSISMPLAVGDCLTKSWQITLRIEESDNAADIGSLAPSLRDLLTSTLIYLRAIEHEEAEMGKTECSRFMNDVADIKTDLEFVGERFPGLVGDLIEMCDEIAALLKRLLQRS